MARAKSIKTKHPGVFRLEGQPGMYRLRGDVINVKTGKKRALDNVFEAKSDREAAALRLEELAKLEAELPAPEERQRLSAYAASWSLAKRPSLKKSTRTLYAGVLDNNILPELGDYYVDAIDSTDLCEWRDRQALLLVKRKGKIEPISPTTVNGRLRILKEMIRDAVEDLNLPRDPTRRVEDLRELTAEEDDEETAKSLTAPQLAMLLEEIRRSHPQWYPFFYMLAFTGMRFGEASALKWSDLDVDGGRIRVQRAQWKGHIDTTKNASKKRGKGRRSGKRSVPVFPELLQVLNEHRVALREVLVKRMKREKVPNFEQVAAEAAADWMFPAHRRNGAKLMHNTAPAKPLKAALKKLPELPQDFTVHGLRHTFNNLVRQAAENEGQNVVVRAMTGHSSEEMTDHYSHVAIGEKAALVGKVVHLVRVAKG